jgi:hypothetical protein
MEDVYWRTQKKVQKLIENLAFTDKKILQKV